MRAEITSPSKGVTLSAASGDTLNGFHSSSTRPVLRTYPEAPLRKAFSTKGRSAYIVRKTIFTELSSFRIILAA